MRRIGIFLLAGLVATGLGCQAPAPTPVPIATPEAEVIVGAPDSPASAIVPSEITVGPLTPTPAGIRLVAPPAVRVELPTPYRFQAPDIGVDAVVVGVGLEAGGAMAAPKDPFTVGWYYPGAKPGSGGNALLSGHVDYWDATAQRGRPGVFWRLSELKPGAKVYITDGSSRYTFSTTEIKWFAYNDPAALAYLQPGLGARLTLITCGGDFDVRTWNYQKRLLVIASLGA